MQENPTFTDRLTDYAAAAIGLPVAAYVLYNTIAHGGITELPAAIGHDIERVVTAPKALLPSIHHEEAAPKISLKGPHLTVASRASTARYEDLLGCNLQSHPERERWPRQKASDLERRCAQHAAALIGKNSYGWGPKDMAALKELWNNESQWSANAANSHSSARGIAQALMRANSHGNEIHREFGYGATAYENNVISQIQWGEKYIHERYGNPVVANRSWHSRSPHWY